MYKSIWLWHWSDLQKIYAYKFQNTYGPLSEEKKHEVEKLINCGKFQNGFERHTCPECGTVLLIPFTCKSRLCLSCARKRLFAWSLNLSHIMNTSLKHSHVTFTVPGTISGLLFERNYKAEQMIALAAGIYRNFLVSTAKLEGKGYRPGILATLHKSGNGLNYNPHVHLIGSRELLNIETGEIRDIPFIPYQRIRHVWKNAFLIHLKKRRIINEEEYFKFDEKYKNGFHIYFQPINGDHNEVLFRTAEYIASGYFHNSQIMEVNHAKKTVTFKYKKWVDRRSGEKSYAVKTMDVYSFMARMLFFLPGKHRKMLRYYGIYAININKKLAEIDRRTWAWSRVQLAARPCVRAKAIERSFNKDPEICPECSSRMVKDRIFSFNADREMKKLLRSHALIKGYFFPYKQEARPP